MAKVHFKNPEAVAGPAEIALCGWVDVPMTSDVAEVTCKLCDRELAREAERLAADPPFVPTGPAPARYGARELTPLSKAALERTVVVAAERTYRWKSPRHALRQLAAYRRDGAAVGSTSNPSRFEKAPRGRADPMQQVAGQVDHLKGVMVAVDRAYPEPRRLTWTVCGVCDASSPCEGHEGVVVGLDLSPADQRAILLLAHERPLDRVAWMVELACEPEKLRGRPRVTEHQIKMIVRAGVDAVAEHLRAIEEMPPARSRAGRESATMAVRGYDLNGWDEIEEYTGISVGALRPLSKRSDDPLPVYSVPGARAYQARKSELDAWLKRHASQIAG